MRRLIYVSVGLLALLLGTVPAALASESVPVQAVKAGPSASALLGKLKSCQQISDGKYKTDTEKSRTIAVCGAKGAVFWTADMDIDCDGITTSKCNKKTDPWYQDDTFLHTSKDKPFNAETMPYVVIPSPSGTFDYRKNKIKPGAVVAVIYKGQVQYAVFADTGPKDIIGEASYASAKQLGIDPDPKNGGTESGVSYIVFQNSVVSPAESQSAAVKLGEKLATDFVNNN